MQYHQIPLGAKRDPHDPRDLIKARVSAPSILPTSSFLEKLPEIKNQGIRSSCTGHAVGYMWEHSLKSRNVFKDALSPLYLWYYGRAREGESAHDSGVTMRSAVDALHDKGACLLSQWGYDHSYEVEPDLDCQTFGAALKIPRYERCMSIEDIKYCIAIERQSAVIAVPVHDNWYLDQVTRTGCIPEPGAANLVGFHAIAITGYDDRFGWIEFANSWGKDWGKEGYGYLPYDCLETSNGFDAWTVGYEMLPQS